MVTKGNESHHVDIDLSLIVSAFNEEGNVEPFYHEAVRCARIHNSNLEIVFVDDGSTDNTYSKLKEAVRIASEQNDIRVKVISFSRNFGKESAMYAGLQNATGQYQCLIDADLQQPPETAFQMLDLLKQNPDYDCVAAFQESRKEQGGSLTSWFSHKFYSMLSKSSGMPVISDASDFRVFKAEVGSALLSMKEYYRFSKGMFAWIGFRTLPFPYTPRERLSGTTTWSFKKLCRYAIDGLLSFTSFPLRIATYLGLLVSLAAFLYMMVVLFQRLVFGADIPGYTTIVILILFLGGVQLLVLGIIGEYLARMYAEEKRRPVYIVRKKLDSECLD